MSTVESKSKSIRTTNGVNVSYAMHGSATDTPPLVLVHGAFSDHRTNWEFVLSALVEEFKVYAIARRGRGGTDSTPVRRLDDEANDVVELIQTIGTEVFLLGHSDGAQVALRAATMLMPGSVRKLILYEPPAAGLMSGHMERLEGYARHGDWSGLSCAFFRDVLHVPAQDLDAMKVSGW